MATARSKIYQFKISLKGIKPKIWRRIQVPGKYSFYELHAAIQDAMGWSNCHLHEFTMKIPTTGQRISIGSPSPDDLGFGPETIPEENAKIARYFVSAKTKATYLYDFGDGWNHEIVLEKIISPEADVDYPRCVAGKRACPPEDCGGSWGYQKLLEIIRNPLHDEHKERMEWMDELGYDDFDPEEFDPKSVQFMTLFFS